MNADKTTLFVVDDDPDACRSAAALASSLGIACETYPSAESFLQAYGPPRSGCLLIDLRLGGMSGFELQEELAARGIALPVIVISAYADVRAAVRLMRNGALTVLEKPYQADELAEAIRLALETDRLKRSAGDQLRQMHERLHALCPREKQTLELIVTGKPNKLIAQELGVSSRTVDRLRATVFRKLGVETAVELATLVGRLQASGEAEAGALVLGGAAPSGEGSIA